MEALHDTTVTLSRWDPNFRIDMYKLIYKWIVQRHVRGMCAAVGFRQAPEKNYLARLKLLTLDEELIHEHYLLAANQHEREYYTKYNPTVEQQFLAAFRNIVITDELRTEKLSYYIGDDWTLAELNLQDDDLRLAFALLGTLSNIYHGENIIVVCKLDNEIKVAHDYDAIMYNSATYYIDHPANCQICGPNGYPYICFRLPSSIRDSDVDSAYYHYQIPIPVNNTEQMKRWYLAVLTHFSCKVGKQGIQGFVAAKETTLNDIKRILKQNNVVTKI